MKVVANVSVVLMWICATSDRLPTDVSGPLYLEEDFIGLHPDPDTPYKRFCAVFRVSVSSDIPSSPQALCDVNFRINKVLS